MPEYHRGKARSMYRKRFTAVNIITGQAGVKTQTLVPSPLSGLVETKSWRGQLIVRGTGKEITQTPPRASGWVGWYRGQLAINAIEALPGSTLLAQSEIIGVQPWTLGYNDHVIPMELIGVTLAVTEYLVFVCTTHFASGALIQFDGGFVYAEKEVPA